jgi:hypothetical protein
MSQEATIMGWKLRAAPAFAVLSAFIIPSVAERAMAQATVPPLAKEDVLTPEEKAERDARKSCKVAICAAMRNRKPGADVSCNVIKTWRKEQLDKLVGRAGVKWPWGRVKCTAPINLKRDVLINALAGPKYEANIGKHQVHCEVERKDGNADIRFQFSPKVTFEGGKATKAALRWGKIEAPTLVKGAMWTATATDNTFNVLQRTVVDDINDFATAKCDEVKAEWQEK